MHLPWFSKHRSGTLPCFYFRTFTHTVFRAEVGGGGNVDLRTCHKLLVGLYRAPDKLDTLE